MFFQYFVGFWVIDPEPLLVGTSLEWWYAENGWRNCVTISNLWNSPGWWTIIIQHLKWIKWSIYLSWLWCQHGEFYDVWNRIILQSSKISNDSPQPPVLRRSPVMRQPNFVRLETLLANLRRVQRRENWKRRENMGEHKNSQHGSWNMLINHDKLSDLSLISSRTVPFEAVRQAASSSARTGQKNNQRAGGLVKIISNIPSIFTSARLGVYLQNTEVWMGWTATRDEMWKDWWQWTCPVFSGGRQSAKDSINPQTMAKCFHNVTAVSVYFRIFMVPS